MNEYNWPRHIDVYRLGGNDYAIFRLGEKWYYRGYNWIVSAEPVGPYLTKRQALTAAGQYDAMNGR